MEKNINLLVTGGRGYIGSNTISVLFNLYPNINWVVVGLSEESKKNTIDKNITESIRYIYYQCNIGDKKNITKILHKHKINYVLDLAALMPWESKKLSQDEIISNNVIDRNTFFNALVEYGKISHIIYQSSFFALTYASDSYNLTKNISIIDNYDHILYGTTKSTGLTLAGDLQLMDTLPITIVSPSHIYGGNNQHPEDFIITLTKELCENNKIILCKNAHTNYDNWLNIIDLIKSYDIIFSQGYTHKNYNPHNSNQYYTDYNLAQMIVSNIKKSTNYSKYIAFDKSYYTFTPNFKNYKIQTNFLPNQFVTINNFPEEVEKITKCRI